MDGMIPSTWTDVNNRPNFALYQRPMRLTLWGIPKSAEL